MRKEDLKDGMIVEVEFTAIPNERYIKLGNLCVGLNDYIELEYATEDLCWESRKIVKIFKSKSMTWLKDINKDNKLELIWQREREIDWSKVPKWTLVRVRDFENENWQNNNFIEKSNDTLYPFVTTYCNEMTFTDFPYKLNWKQCEIHPSVEIEEEWCK